MLSEHLQECFFNLSCINGDTRFFHLFHLVAIELHKFNVWIPLDRLQLIIDDLIVRVDAIDVLEQTFEHRHRSWDSGIDQERTTEVSTCLHQVLRAEMILGILANIITTER